MRWVALDVDRKPTWQLVAGVQLQKEVAFDPVRCSTPQLPRRCPSRAARVRQEHCADLAGAGPGV